MIFLGACFTECVNLLCVVSLRLSFSQALRVSMEEQRQRQEEEARRAAAQSAAEAGITTPTADGRIHQA